MEILGSTLGSLSPSDSSLQVREAIQTSLPSLFDPDFRLTEFQINAIETCLAKKITIVSLGTGGGKTAIFQLLQFVKYQLTGRHQLSVVLSPLESLIKSQVGRLAEGTAIHYNGNNGVTEDVNVLLARQLLQDFDGLSSTIASGHLTFLYLCPESFASLRPMMTRLIDSQLIGSIAVDESHYMFTCTDNFRPEYKYLYKSLPFKDVPISLFSGTNTSAVLNGMICNFESISQNAASAENLAICHGPVDRPNIFLISKMISSEKDGLNQLDIILDAMWAAKDHPLDFRPIVIYTTTTKQTLLVMTHLIQNGPPTFRNSIIRYHSQMDDEARRTAVVEDFIRADSIIRIVVSTSALGCGMNKPNVGTVICFTQQKDHLEMIQMLGRACRNGDSGMFIMFCIKRKSMGRRGKKAKRGKTCINFPLESYMIIIFYNFFSYFFVIRQ